jgi:hypothetical protein
MRFRSSSLSFDPQQSQAQVASTVERKLFWYIVSSTKHIRFPDHVVPVEKVWIAKRPNIIEECLDEVPDLFGGRSSSL